SDLSDDKNESDISFNTQENQSKNDLELILKEMPFANEETLNKTIEEYRLQLYQLINIQLPTSNKNAIFLVQKISLLIIYLKNLYLVVLKDRKNLRMNWIFTLTLDGH
ncbi:13344_t:CDS:2, partial [Gigaspora margarita]